MPTNIGDEFVTNRADTKQKCIQAPVAKVFQAFSHSEKLALWWGPNGFTNTINEFDLRDGGFWRYVMHGPDGTNYPNESKFLEVIENKKIVIEHLSGHHFILTLEFNTTPDGTRVDWEQLFDTAAHYQSIAEFVSDANQQNLNRLEQVVIGQAVC